MDVSGYGRLQEVSSTVATAVLDGGEVEGDVGAGAGVCSTPGRVGCARNKTIKMAVMAMPASNQFKALVRLIPLA